MRQYGTLARCRFSGLRASPPPAALPQQRDVCLGRIACSVGLACPAYPACPACAACPDARPEQITAGRPPIPKKTLNPQRQTLNGRFGGSKAAPAPGPPRKMGRGHEKKHPRARFGELENTRNHKKDAELGNLKSLDNFWKALFVDFLEALTKNEQKRPTQMGSKMRLWRGAASVVSRRHHHRRRVRSHTMSA